MSKEAMKLALEALAVRFSEGWHEGIKIDASDIMLLNDAAQALAEQPAQQALNKMAQNARDIGLDYEPSAGTQVSKVWRDGGKLVAKQVPLEDFYKPAQHRAWFTVDELNAWADKKLKENPQWEEQPAQQGQVATVVSESGNPNVSMSWWHEPALPVGAKIYTSPPAQRTWVGLTEEDENKLLEAVIGSLPIAKNLIRAIEAKLREKNT